MTIAADEIGSLVRANEHRVATTSGLRMQLVGPELWDRTISTFDDVCQEQLHVFARTRWPKVSHEPLLFWRGTKVVGGCLVMIQPLPLKLGALAVVKWGPMLAGADQNDGLATYALMVDALVAEYAQKRRLMLSVLPRASLTAFNAEYDHLVHRGFSKGSVLGFPNRYIVNLRLSDEAQRKSFEQKWRYHLKKSEKAGLSFEPAGTERLDEFETLYAQMLDRKRFADHSAYETLPALMEMPNHALRPELFFVRHEGEIIAGAVIFKAGNRAVYLYGATVDRALPLRAGYFMHWNIILWLRDNTRAGWYDLGGTDGFHGLHQFKKGMVGEGGVIQPVPPVANYASHWWPRQVGNAAFGGRDLAQNLLRRLDWLRKGRAKPDQKREQEDGE
ncbi:MAG: peptidoglycan bridge formation glycyltransferase FemA/FemB family protein [Devosia sp.]